MKEILFLCGCFPEECENEYLENSIGLIQVAADRLQKNIIRGIQESGRAVPHVLTAPFVGYYSAGYKKLFVKDHEYVSDNIRYSIVGFPTIKGLETYVKSVRLARRIIQWCRASKENRHLIVYSHYTGFMRAIGIAKRRFPDLNVCCVITDMPELTAVKPTTFRQWCKTLPSRAMFAITYKNLPCVDKFVLLSKHMATPLGLQQEDFTVVECMCDPALVGGGQENPFLPKRKADDIYFAYSGTLFRTYGILELLQAFASIDNPRFHLWICGEGDAKPEVQAAAKKDSRIEYFGSLRHSDVINWQQAADILINPRSSEGRFTQYSFPSKTIEYMLAGKPVIAYKLAGIPEDYDDYLLYVNGGVSGLAESISRCGLMSRDELCSLGEHNRRFAEENKNYLVQTKKILNIMGI